MIVAFAAVVGVVLLLAISTWQDQRFRQKQIALAHEAEERALGPENPPSPSTFFPMQLVPRPPLVSGIQLLEGPDAGEKIETDELVIGVLVNGQARAYPINTMTGPAREVFNDKVAGIEIAATW